MLNRVMTRTRNFLIRSPRAQRLVRWLLLNACAPLMRLFGFGNRMRKAVLYVGQAYYNSWYLSRALRELGWSADLLNWDMNPGSQIYYHGEDFRIEYQSQADIGNFFRFYFNAVSKYDVFHFANKGGLQFGEPMRAAVKTLLGEEGFEIRFLKALGKKVVYSNNGCLDGVSQTAFSRWGPESICSICRWQHEPTVCSDERNLAWGKFRNEVTDYQCLLGGNRVDHNDDPRVHEVPEFYCLDKNLWHPDLEIPKQYELPKLTLNVIRFYHAVGHRAERTRSDGVNIKSSHIYLPLVDRLRMDGYQLELIEPTGIPNKEVRYLQAQADIFLDMLSYGWFGANAREAMMLGKPVICFLRPEWLESARQEIPDYIDELPIVSATPQSVEGILRDLIDNKEKRLEIGRRSREFAVKWHSAEVGARRFVKIYGQLQGFEK
jgi:glycosyltransferase involved in cell wall biosynthesis